MNLIGGVYTALCVGDRLRAEPPTVRDAELQVALRTALPEERVPEAVNRALTVVASPGVFPAIELPALATMLAFHRSLVLVKASSRDQVTVASGLYGKLLPAVAERLAASGAAAMASPHATTLWDVADVTVGGIGGVNPRGMAALTAAARCADAGSDDGDAITCAATAAILHAVRLRFGEMEALDDAARA